MMIISSKTTQRVVLMLGLPVRAAARARVRLLHRMEPKLSQASDIFTGRKLILAPLVGGSDLSYRLLSRKYGAQVTFTEMCVAEYFLQSMKDPKAKHKERIFEFHPSDRPLVAQLTGMSAAPIIELANMDMLKGHVDMIDLNCGCPQNCALDSGYGAAWMAKGDQLVDLCKEIVPNIPYPLSVKCRLHENTQYTIALLKRLRDVGVQAFTVHKGKLRGKADWDAIQEIRAAFPDVPIVGNGDVVRHEDIQRMFDHTGVDAVMVGHGALLNPTLFQPAPIALEQIVEDYLLLARLHRNKLIDVLRHTAWIIKKRLPSSAKRGLFECRNLEAMRQYLTTLEPPLHITLKELPEGQTDRVVFPKAFESMTPREQRKYERAQIKINRKRKKKEERGPKEPVDEDEVDDLIAG